MMSLEDRAKFAEAHSRLLREKVKTRLVDVRKNAAELEKMTVRLLSNNLSDAELEAIQDALTAMLLALQVTSTEIATCANHR